MSLSDLFKVEDTDHFDLPLAFSIDNLLAEHAEARVDALDEDHYDETTDVLQSSGSFIDDNDNDDDDAEHAVRRAPKRELEPPPPLPLPGDDTAAAVDEDDAAGASKQASSAANNGNDDDDEEYRGNDDDDDDDDDDEEFVPSGARGGRRRAPPRTARAKARATSSSSTTSNNNNNNNNNNNSSTSSSTNNSSTATAGAKRARKKRNAGPPAPSPGAPKPALLSAALAPVQFSAAIDAAYNELKRIESELAACEREQAALGAGDAAAFGALVQRYDALASALTEKVVKPSLHALASEQLASQDVARALWLSDQRVVAEGQCTLLRREASELQAKPDAQPLPVVALAITQQPFPLSLIQNKQIDEPVVLRLLKGTRTDIVSLSEVEANMIVNYTPKSASELEVTGGKEKMPADVLSVRFNKIKFKHGTRKKKAILKFRQKVQVRYNGREVPLDVESNASKPFVVKTNERQWREAEQSLLLLAAFGGRVRVSFAQFYNAYHWHFLRAATKQLPAAPQRPLSQTRARAFIARLFFDGATQVTQSAFNRFWQWVGPTEHKLAHQRDLAGMFNAGLIVGFVTRAEAISLLQSRSPGTFLLRFSVKYAGEFAISFRTQSQVKHYAIKPDDVMLQHLADFILSSEHALRTLLAVDPTTDNYVELDARGALKPFCSANKGMEPPDGYEKTVSEFARLQI